MLFLSAFILYICMVETKATVMVMGNVPLLLAAVNVECTHKRCQL